MTTLDTSILQASALELQERLTSGSLTSVELTTAFLDRIDRHNHRGLKLNALISVCPRDVALEAARRLDRERSAGTVRSRLHGIPVVVKDAIVTDQSLGMPTTVGSHVFASMKTKGNASLAARLLDAGLIVLGKANMTEFCGLKSNEPMGWSSYAGQTLSPYRSPDLPENQQPISGGSSSGSAVSVAASFCPLAIGTETAGSVVLPASCNGLYGLKVTPGSVPTDGVFQLSESFDAVGIMARYPGDVAALAEILQASYTTKQGSGLDSDASMGVSSLSGLSIGVVSNTWGLYSTEKWTLPDVVTSYKNAVQLLRSRGARVVYPLEAPDHSVLTHKGETLTTVAYNEFPAQVERFISNLEPDANIKTLADIIRWNEDHAEIALPEPYSSQSELISSLNSTMPESTRLETVEALRRLADIEGLGKVMREQDLDMMLAPSDSTLVSFAACAGWPIATVPLGRTEGNGQPFGFFAIARERREEVLLGFMRAWEGLVEVGGLGGCFE